MNEDDKRLTRRDIERLENEVILKSQVRSGEIPNDKEKNIQDKCIREVDDYIKDNGLEANPESLFENKEHLASLSKKIVENVPEVIQEDHLSIDFDITINFEIVDFIKFTLDYIILRYYMKSQNFDFNRCKEKIIETLKIE